MRILVIGGTQFVGRHIVDALLVAGDDVTLFHRGQTNPDLFAEAEHRFGDRSTDLSALQSGQWDATVDVCAYFPRVVRSLADALGGRGGRYVQISSVSAYGPPSGPGLTEDAPLATLDDPATEVVDNETYGGLKAACERVAAETFGADGTTVNIVRPTYVVGPHDHTGRFTYWVERAARGGRVLAPGPASNPFQAIDVRDLAAFVALLAHGEAAGTFHTVHPAPPFSCGEFLELAVRTVGPPGTELVWVEPDELAAGGIGLGDFPLWAGTEPDRDLSALDPARAIAAGLRPRPLEQTISELHSHEVASPTPVRSPVAPSPEREAELLAATPL